MANLTGPRKINQLDGPDYSPVPLPVAASTKIYDGQMVGKNSSGYWVPASTTIAALGIARLGIYDDQNQQGQASNLSAGTGNVVDNSAGADGDRFIVVGYGTFKLDNKAGDLCTTLVDYDATVYVSDDHTVRHTAASSVAAGICKGVDTDGQVYVAIGNGPYARI